jgi:hypothetical protein
MKLKQTSPDKIRGKLVKYRLGDCLSIKLINGCYLGAIMTGKFNKYYNLTFIEFNEAHRPTLNDFIQGRFFGTRFGSIKNTLYGVDQRMIECKFIDNNQDVELVQNLELIPNFVSAGYAYLKDIDEMLEYYLEELPARIEKSKLPEKAPEFGFGGIRGRFIETRYIINS